MTARLHPRTPRAINAASVLSASEAATPPETTRSILVGDCLDHLGKLPSESIDVVVTSPPYNIGIGYKSYADKRARADYLRWLRRVFRAVARVLKPHGSFFLNVGATNVDPWLAMDVARQAALPSGGGFVLQNHIIWAKSVAVGELTHGHFKPINSERFLNNTYEDLFPFTKTGRVKIHRRAIGVPFVHKSNIARFGHSEDRRCKGNIWHVPYETVQNRSQKGDHPAIYPVALVEQCLKLHGVDPCATVLDPFLGTGTHAGRGDPSRHVRHRYRTGP